MSGAVVKYASRSADCLLAITEKAGAMTGRYESMSKQRIFVLSQAAVLGVSLLVASCVLLAIPVRALALNPERHYEMVSPVYKGGFGAAEINAVAENGQSVAYRAPGAFEGQVGYSTFDYLARREATQWSTVSLSAPTSVASELLNTDVTPNLDLKLEVAGTGTNAEAAAHEATSGLYLYQTTTPDTPADWETAGLFHTLNGEVLTPSFQGASESFCHVIFATNIGEPLLPEALQAEKNEVTQLFDYSRGCSGRPRTLKIVGVNNEGPEGRLLGEECPAAFGNSASYTPPGRAPNEFNAVSLDGEEVFFTKCTRFGEVAAYQLFVRLGGSRTVEVSRPLTACIAHGVAGEVPCEGAGERASAAFVGASEDGSTVYFTTGAPLVAEDHDTGQDLYEARIGCAAAKPDCAAGEREVVSLTQVSHDPTAGQAAEVQGVVRVAPDGARVYFVARGDLLEGARQVALQSEGRPVPQAGADNLYVYDSNTGTLAFIADLCSGGQVSGLVADARCPNPTGSDEVGLWLSRQENEVQTAGADGRFLVFGTYAQLAQDDTNRARDVYRYGAVTGSLVRVSGGEAGYDADGNREIRGANGEVLGASIKGGSYAGSLYLHRQMADRAVSEDGSRIVFFAAAPLSPLATNGLENLYEWHETPGGGQVSLLSGGSGEQPVKEAVISPSGADVFFVTSDGLVPRDTDDEDDIYDARLGSGFPAAPTPVQPCSGDACQGPLTNPAPLLVPGSESQTPGGNLSVAPQPLGGGTSKSHSTVKRKRCARRRSRKIQKCASKAPQRKFMRARSGR